jgi:hypothetical protein
MTVEVASATMGNYQYAKRCWSHGGLIPVWGMFTSHRLGSSLGVGPWLLVAFTVGWHPAGFVHCAQDSTVGVAISPLG